jgi:hypothetical protein
MESARISGVDRHQTIYVDTQGENVWISLHIPNGSAFMSITPVEAQRMIKALETAIKNVEQYEAKEEARLDAMFDARYGDE